jgi:type IV pilus assembly protein PilY1
MELDAVTGAKTTGSSFDFNNDGAFDGGDNLASGAVASGVKTTVGITKPPAWFTPSNSGSGGGSGTTGTATDFKVMTGTTGGIETVNNKGAQGGGGGGGGGVLRRVYWLQIQ